MEIATYIHPIHGLIQYFPNICQAKCKKVIFYRRHTKRNGRTIRMCNICSRTRQSILTTELVICHWVTFGDINFIKCEYCNAPLETTRSIFECRDCVFSYFDRAVYENNRGRDINNLVAFAYCRTHQQGLYIENVPPIED